MDSKKQRVKSESLSLAKGLCVDVWRLVRARPGLLWGMLGLGVLGVAVLVPFDASMLAAIQVSRESWVHDFAEQASIWGEMDHINLVLLLVVLGLGVWLRRREWKRAVLAITLAAVLSGIFINFIRPTVGRPRPSAELADGLYGPSLKHDFHGFPSGHTTTAFATGVAACVLCPPAAVPALAFSITVGWSRLQMNKHHPADVFAGAVIGSTFGLYFGWAARQQRRREATSTAAATPPTP